MLLNNSTRVTVAPVIIKANSFVSNRPMFVANAIRGL